MSTHLKVECYAGYKADERPLRFSLGSGGGGRMLEVKEVLDQWYSPDSTYFKVRASDGNDYILRYHSASDEWTLESFRHPAEQEQKDV